MTNSSGASAALVSFLLAASAAGAEEAAPTTETARWTGYADRFFDEADYYRAITFYKLAGFDGLPEEEAARVGFRVVEAYRLAGRPAEAAAEAGALAARLPNRFRPQARLLAGEAYLLARQPGFAQAALESVGEGEGEAAARERALFLLAYAHAEQGRWADAERGFSGLASASAALGGAAAAAAGVAGKYRDGLPSRSVPLAFALSIVPGLGQLYAGAWQEALLSLVLNAGLGFVTFDAVRRATPNDFVPAVLWVGVASTFFFGNMYAAGVAARRFNEDAIAEARMEMAGAAFAPAFGMPPPPDWREAH